MHLLIKAAVQHLGIYLVLRVAPTLTDVKYAAAGDDVITQTQWIGLSHRRTDPSPQ